MRSAKYIPLCMLLLPLACDRREPQDRESPYIPPKEEVKAPEPSEPLTRPAAGQRVVSEAKVATLKAAEGVEIDGEAKLEDTGQGVRIVVELEDAPPGPHAVHIHEKGDCSNVRGKSMGGHFAPEGDEHGLPSEAQKRHLGDLGNVTVDEDGNARLEITVERANLVPNDPLSFLGKALVVHSGQDLGKSHQPAGGAGDPIACGVIERE